MCACTRLRVSTPSTTSCRFDPAFGLCITWLEQRKSASHGGPSWLISVYSFPAGSSAGCPELCWYAANLQDTFPACLLTDCRASSLGVICWYWPTLQASDCQALTAQGVKAVVFGVPDMGKVCTEQHVPSYLNSMNELRSAGVDKLVCLAVSEPTVVQEWAKKAGLQGDKVCSCVDSAEWLSDLARFC